MKEKLKDFLAGKLKEWKGEKEQKIKVLAEEKQELMTRAMEEGAEDKLTLFAEAEKAQGEINNNRVALNRIEMRIINIQSGKFQPNCHGCAKNIEKELIENPLREFCPRCQIEQNNNKKKGIRR